jgi:enamine deaminase RidA (YjgF/YER057c/UK114 family)
MGTATGIPRATRGRPLPATRRSILLAGLVPELAQTAGVSAEQRVRDLGLQLPRFATPPVGNNPALVQTGNLVFLAGLGPRNQDGSYVGGRLGQDTTVEQGYQYARMAGLRALAALEDGLGNLDRVSRIVKLLGMVNVTPDFTDLGRVINGCSDLFVDVFGSQRGRHARTVVGVASLPANLTVVIDLVVETA